MSTASTSRRTQLNVAAGPLPLWIVGSAAATVAILLTLMLARAHPDGAFAGRSLSADLLEAAAAAALVAVGLLSRRGGPTGPLLVIAGFAWLLPEWTNPDADFAPLFTVGLVAVGATTALLVHLALVHPDARLATRPDRTLVLATYVAALVGLGLLPLLVFDPRAQGCVTCPRNLAQLHGDAALYAHLSRWGIWLAVVVFAVAVVAIAVRVARLSTRARRALAPLLASTAAFVVVTEIDLGHSVGRGILSNDATDVRLWKAQGVCLLLVAAAVALGVIRARRTRAAMAALVVDLSHGPRVGGARVSLAATLNDPHLRLLYRRVEADGYVGLHGEAVAPGAGRAVTQLVRDGNEIALMEHDADLLAEPHRVSAAIAAARLAVDSERLQAELRAQARELRESRRRIVEEGDSERRRLERDLHDGAQQRLVGLSLALRMLRDQTGDADARRRVDAASAQLSEALTELREIAHGIYPAALGADGIPAALEDLAEHAEPYVRIDGVLHERLAPPVEQAAYFAISELVRDLREGDAATVRSARVDGRLLVEVECVGQSRGLDDRLVEIDDRVVALGGDVTATRAAEGALTVQLRIPCAS